PDDGVKSKKDLENAPRELQPTSSDERVGNSGIKILTDSAEDHNALEESLRPGGSLGYTDETKEDGKGEPTLESPDRGVEGSVDPASHGHMEGKDGT
ncbi:hypothetical protein PQX77_015221, partial [Marasmius sp. AFHP31]